LKVGDLRKQPSFDNPFLPEARYAHLIARSLRADPIYLDVFNTSHATPEVAAIE
jgi:hypothetical protein